MPNHNEFAHILVCLLPDAAASDLRPLSSRTAFPYVLTHWTDDFLRLYDNNHFKVAIIIPPHYDDRPTDLPAELIKLFLSPSKHTPIIVLHGKQGFSNCPLSESMDRVLLTSISWGSFIYYELLQLHVDLDSLRVSNENTATSTANSETKTTSSTNSETFTFDFLPEFSTACEQYLLYFHDFLTEVGIAAKTDLSHEAGKVLFTVTPEGPDDALGKISQALRIYRHLPVIADTSFDPSDSIAVQVLGAQIKHLESQLMHAMAALECKQKTIELLIGQDQLPLMLIQSYEHKPDEEELFGGLIKVGNAELGKIGIKIALGEIVRRARKFFADRE